MLRSVYLRASPHLPKAYTFGAQALNSLSNLLIAWYLVRRIGVDGFGYYATYFMVAVNVSAITIGLLIQPLNSIASQVSAKRRAELIAGAKLGQWLLAAIILIVGLLGTWAAVVFGQGAMIGLAVTAYCISMSFGEFWRRIYFVESKAGTALSYDLVRFGLMIVGSLLLANLPFDGNAEFYTLALSATYFIAAALISGPRKERAGILSLARQRALLRRLVRSGKWLGMAEFLRFVGLRSPILLSFYVLGASETGLLRIAQMLVGLLNPAIQVLEHIIPASYGRRVREKGIAHARKLHFTGSVAIIAAFIVAYLALIILSDWLLQFFGSANSPDMPALLVGFALAMILTVATALYSIEVRSRETTRAVFDALVITSIATLLIAKPAMDASGAIGAVATLVGAQFSNLMLLRWLIKRQSASK